MNDILKELPKDLQACVTFHGHLCPGLVYGYIVSKEVKKLLDIKRAEDEEVIAISENDSCAVDALQVILGTTMGKGNLIVKNYGKSVFVIFDRKSKAAYRFSKKQEYLYAGKSKDEFDKLDRRVSNGTAKQNEKKRQKYLKARDLLSRSFSEVFETEKIIFREPAYAELAPSELCAECGEATMNSKLCKTASGESICIPCSKKFNLL